MLGIFGSNKTKQVIEQRFELLLKNSEGSVDPTLLKTFKSWLSDAPLGEIDVPLLAREWNISRHEILPILLHAANVKLLDLSYRVHCDKCHGTGNAPSLQMLKGEMICPACTGQTHPELGSSVEVTFSPNVDVVSAKKTQVNKPTDYVTAIEVANTQEFRQLFEQERPLPGEHIQVNKLTFFFTDLSGSTATYEKLGDGNAFRIVREHFNLLFDLIKKHDGAVVKTIGDAVMATFLHPEDAILCAVEAKESFRKFNARDDIKGKAEIKIGIHSGKCIAVTLNSRLDFFGSTVNKAARVQGIAKKDQVCISAEIASLPTVKRVLDNIPTTKESILLKGITRSVDIVRI